MAKKIILSQLEFFNSSSSLNFEQKVEFKALEMSKVLLRFNSFD